MIIITVDAQSGKLDVVAVHWMSVETKSTTLAFLHFV